MTNQGSATQLVQFSVGATNLCSLPFTSAVAATMDPEIQQSHRTSRADIKVAGRSSRLSGDHQHGLFPGVATALSPLSCAPPPGIAPGIVLVGRQQRIRCRVEPLGVDPSVHPPGPQQVAHCMSVLFAAPGVYQVYVYDVVAAPEGRPVCVRQDGSAGGQGVDGVEQEGRPVYANVQRLHFIVA